MLINPRRQRRGRRIRQHALPAQRDRQRTGLAQFRPRAEMACAVVMWMPVHRGGLGPENLHAVHAEISGVGFGMFRNDLPKRNILSAILRPALNDRQHVEIGIVGVHHFLAQRPGAAATDLGHVPADFEEVDPLFDLVKDAGQAPSGRVSAPQFYPRDHRTTRTLRRHLHPLKRPKRVDAQRDRRPRHLLKQKCLIHALQF